MQVTVSDFAKNRIVFSISGCTREELEYKLSLFFSSEGYKLKSETGENKVFTKGNRVKRILFGAFSPYHKQTININTDGTDFSLLLHRDASGISGGLMGMSQVKKEFSRLSEAFKTYFRN